LVKYNNGSPYSSPNLIKLLTDKNRTKLFHYARFDVAILRHYLKIDEIPSLYCTKIASKLVRTYTDSHGLKTLVREMTGVVLDKEQQTSNWGNDTLTNEQIKYACGDVLYLHKIRDGLEKMFSLIEPERKTIANRCFETINLICSLDLNNFSESIFSHN
jgi:ribonuclease D